MVEYLECKDCDIYFKPFYFNGSNSYRGKMQDCPNCGRMIHFTPEELKTMSEKDELSHRKSGKWMKNSVDEWNDFVDFEVDKGKARFDAMSQKEIDSLKGFDRINFALSQLLAVIKKGKF